jgi:excisionase family DNA binding protein
MPDVENSPDGSATPSVRLYTASQLAEYLNVSDRHVWRLVAQKKIPHLRVGNAIRFDLQSVMDALKG